MIADAEIPFADPYRADLVSTADRLLRSLRATGADCLQARFLRVPASAAAAVPRHYERAVGADWQAVAIDAPPFTNMRAFRHGDARFAVAVADRPERGWSGMVIVTNATWDQPSRDEYERCRGAEGRSA